MDYQLRKPRKEEYDLLFGIKKRAFSECVIETWGAWDDEVQHKFFQEDLGDSGFRVIELDGEVVGMVSFGKEKAVMKLYALYIDPEMQGKGLGTKILQDLIQQAEKEPLVLKLQVLHCNIRAQKLYERVGFTNKGPGHDEHHYLMEYSNTSL